MEIEKNKIQLGKKKKFAHFMLAYVVCRVCVASFFSSRERESAMVIFKRISSGNKLHANKMDYPIFRQHFTKLMENKNEMKMAKINFLAK